MAEFPDEGLDGREGGQGSLNTFVHAENETSLGGLLCQIALYADFTVTLPCLCLVHCNSSWIEETGRGMLGDVGRATISNGPFHILLECNQTLFNQSTSR